MTRGQCVALHYLREHTTRSQADRRSGFARRGITWVMPSAPGALCDAAEMGVCVPLSVAGQLTMSEHLRNTAVERCAHSQSDRAWRKAESVITMSRASDGTLRRVRIGNELLSSLQSSQIKLWRDDYCRSVLGLPPLDFLFGSALGSEQLHLHERCQFVSRVLSGHLIRFYVQIYRFAYSQLCTRRCRVIQHN